MLRAAVISDVHADLGALTSVLAEIDQAGIGNVWNLGDYASGGRQPAECMDICQERCEINLLGNHEMFVLARVWERMPEPTSWALHARYAYGALGSGRLETLRHSPAHAVSGNPSLEMVHAHLADPIGGWLRNEAEALTCMRLATTKLVLSGHTHRAAFFAQAEDPQRELPERQRVALGVEVSLPDRIVLLNPGAVCDGVGARWLELRFDDDGRRFATWHRTGVRGHGGKAPVLMTHSSSDENLHVAGSSDGAPTSTSLRSSDLAI